jgi:hypothetical protein
MLKQLTIATARPSLPPARRDIDLGIANPNCYRVFDPAVYRNRAAKWHFPQENATCDELETLTCGSKTL